MAIEINSITSTKAQRSTDDTKLNQSSDQPAAQQETGKSSATDTVSLSDDAVQLGKVEHSVATTPVIDTQRVEQLKQAIANGSYEVDAGKVADKLMQFESILKS
ncbi:MAG: flagellar biosynthesis anti-sigma factor FlgM [Gammaproteobacteria bacterium]|nr:flagellar biosynthesis anti-sigma factor FlgM [Gammaproteobacteria bacterium]